MIVKFGVKNPTLVNLFMVLILVSGVVVFYTMPRDLIPMFRTNAISITTAYHGASPEEIDRLITAKITDAIEDLEGVDDVLGTSTEGFSSVVVQTRSDFTDDETYNLLDEIRTAIDREKSELPEDATDPTTMIIKPLIPVINIAVYGSLPDIKLKEYAEDLQTILKSIDGVNKVTIETKSREIWIEISPKLLEKYSLTIDQVRASVKMSQFDLAAGTLKTDTGEYLVRTSGETDCPVDLKEIVVAANPLGGEVRLSDIAKVSDTFSEPLTIGRYNGKPAILLMLTKNLDGDTIDIAQGVYKAINEYVKGIPASVKVGTFWDTSTLVETRLSTMLTQGAQALILVLATLCLFLTFRMAFFTALGIPISFLGGLILLHLMGYTLNMITMFAFIIVLGLVVDDAIVVSENCFRIMEKGVKPRTAAIIGTRQMVSPVVAAVTTTIAAFLPLMLMSGVMGKFLSVIPVTVTVVLLVSLFEGIVILPSHIADWTPEEYGRKMAERKRKKGGGIFSKFLGVYEKALSFVLKWRYSFIAFMMIFFVVVISFAYYCMPNNFMEEFESNQFNVNFECATTYKLEDTLEVAKKVEKVILSLSDKELVGVSTAVGIFADNPYAQRVSSNICQFFGDLVPLDQRRRNHEIFEELRQKIAKIPEIVTFKVMSLQSNPGGAAIQAYISGKEISKLRALSNFSKDYLAMQEGTRDIQDDFILGKREVVVRLNDRAEALGFDNLSVASQLRTMYSGTEVARIRPFGEDFPIYVRYDAKLKLSRTSIEELYVISPTGARVRLVEIARISEGSALRSVKRRNGDRTITVTSDVNTAEGNASLIMSGLFEALEKKIEKDYPGYSVSEGGQQKEQKESLASLGYAGFLALLIILLILTSLFRSIIKTLIIMAPIPLCIVGVVIGHYVMGRDLAIMSYMGVVALAGVVVNDSILVMDFINTARKEGLSPFRAAIQAGKMRMRPVILTTITTICGLSSLAFFATGQTAFLAPMAISIVWGIAFATVITLAVVPALYLVYIDIRRLFGRKDETEIRTDNIDEEIAEFVSEQGMVIDLQEDVREGMSDN